MNESKKIVIIDYQMGNMFSVHRACEFIGCQPVISSCPAVLLEADGAILPGVGAFGEAMTNLQRLGLDKALKEFVRLGKKLFGICLGMQLLMGESEEFGYHKGLGLIPGRVIRFPSLDKKSNKELRIPAMGWNQIAPLTRGGWQNTPLQATNPGEFMYFVHSYYVLPENPNCRLSLTDYEGTEYCSSLLSKNIFATQFHPEKSAASGLGIYFQFLNWVNKGD